MLQWSLKKAKRGLALHKNTDMICIPLGSNVSWKPTRNFLAVLFINMAK